MAPEQAASFPAASLEEIALPIALIGLGAPDPGLSRPEGLAPAARLATLADVTRFGTFSPCARRAAAILAEEGEDEAPCQDGGERSRAAIQPELAQIIEAALAEFLHP